MIQLPRRSVTRFFIPLIDVLTLLFCIFLLMPLVKGTGDASEGVAGAAGTIKDNPPLPTNKNQNEAPDADRVLREQKELERLRTEKIETLQQRLYIRVLELDADSGKLLCQEGDERLEIGSQDEALRLIARHKRDAGDRELYYLFLYPRRLTGFPEEGQVRRYEGWFKGVAHGTDNPRGGR